LLLKVKKASVIYEKLPATPGVIPSKPEVYITFATNDYHDSLINWSFWIFVAAVICGVPYPRTYLNECPFVDGGFRLLRLLDIEIRGERHSQLAWMVIIVVFIRIPY